MMKRLILEIDNMSASGFPVKAFSPQRPSATKPQPKEGSSLSGRGTIPLLQNELGQGGRLLFPDRGTGSFLKYKKQPVPEKVACPLFGSEYFLIKNSLLRALSLPYIRSVRTPVCCRTGRPPGRRASAVSHTECTLKSRPAGDRRPCWRLLLSRCSLRTWERSSRFGWTRRSG